MFTPRLTTAAQVKRTCRSIAFSAAMKALVTNIRKMPTPRTWSARAASPNFPLRSKRPLMPGASKTVPTVIGQPSPKSVL